MKTLTRSAMTALVGVPAAAILSLGGVATAASSDPAQQPAEPGKATTCIYPGHPNKDPGSGFATDDLNRRKGVGTECGIIDSVSQDTKIQYHCTYGEWTHGRIDGIPGANGWFANKYLSDGGSSKSC